MEKVFISIPIGNVEEEQEKPSLTYRLDLATGRIMGKVDGLAAVEQAILKAMITPRFHCLVYDNQYGSEVIDAIIANDATPEYIVAAAEGFVRDCLKPDTRILDITDFTLEFEGDSVRINFRVETIFGEIEIEKVM